MIENESCKKQIKSKEIHGFDEIFTNDVLKFFPIVYMVGKK